MVEIDAELIGRLRDHFPVEVGQLFQKPDVLQKRGLRGPAVWMLTLSLTGAPVAWVRWGRLGLSIIVGSIKSVSYAPRRRGFFGEDGGQPGQREFANYHAEIPAVEAGPCPPGRRP